MLMSGYEVSGLVETGWPFIAKPFGIQDLAQRVADTLREDRPPPPPPQRGRWSVGSVPSVALRPCERRMIVENGADLVRQVVHCKRLDQKWLPWPQADAVVLHRLGAIPGHEQHPDLGTDGPDLLRQLPTVHERHDDVREE